MMDDLFVDETALNTEELAATIRPFSQIGRASNSPVFTRIGEQLSDQRKVLVALLVREAVAAATGGESGMSPAEAAAQSGATLESARKALQRLRGRRLVEKDGPLWKIRRHALGMIREYLGADEIGRDGG